MTIAIYVRQSIDKKDSLSIESQIDICKKEIDNNDFKVYNDKGFSGKNTNRPEFKKMIQDIKNGLITKMVCYRLDRVSRNLLDFANIMEYFEKYDIKFVSCTEKFDTSTPIGKAMLSIIMVFAQLERETIQARVKGNYYARGAKGFYMGGRAPFGLKKIETRVDGKKTYTFENDETKIDTLINMYALYSDTNMSLGKISNYLNSLNIPAAEGGAWDSGKISRILRSPVYVKSDADVYTYYKNKGCNITNDINDFIGINGSYLYGKRESNERKYTSVKDHTLSLGLHKGVIDSTEWLACQYKLDNNKQIKNSGKGKYTWLSGKLKCGKCGYSISVVFSRGKKYLSCRGKTNYKICDGFKEVISTDKVEKIIEKRIFKRVELLRNTNFTEQKIEGSQSNILKIRLVEIDEQINNLMLQLAQAKTVTMKYINQTIEKLDDEKSKILEQINAESVMKNINHSKEEVFEKIDNWINLDMEDKKECVDFLIDKIEIKEDEYKVHWKRVV